MRLNPGNLPEARELFDLGVGVVEVQARIARETAGAVSPRRQLLAAEAVMLRHQEAMTAVQRAAKERHDWVMSASDQCRYPWALMVQAIMADYWLKLGRTFRRLPVEGRPDLSTAKSRKRRETVLAQIQQGAQAAADITRGLREIAPPHPASQRVFEKVRAHLNPRSPRWRAFGGISAGGAYTCCEA